METRLDELRQLLALLSDETKPIAVSKLHTLSDLAGDRWKLFLATWEGLASIRREHLIQALVEHAEANFEVNFDAIYRHSLDDPDEVVRATAIDGLWENEDAGLIGPFLQLLRLDPSSLVRASAAAALGRYVLAGELENLEAPISERILTELLTRFHSAGETVEVRRRALESASYACTADVTDALELAYYEEDDRMQASAVFGMGRSCDLRWRAIVLKELESPSVEMRFEAARASGELGLRQAVPVLARLLDDADRQVREASIWALGQIEGPEAKRVLTEAYQDADEETAAALDEALAEHALQEGDVDFALYELDEDRIDDLVEDELIPLWSANGAEEDDELEEEGDEFDTDDELDTDL